MNTAREEEESAVPEQPFMADDLGDRLEHCRPRLKRMVSLRLDARLRRRLDSSDVLQEAFVAATQRFGEYTTSRNVPFYVWVRQLTLQKLLDAQRRHLAAGKRDVRDEACGEGTDCPEGTSATLARALVDQDRTPSRAAIQREQEQHLRAALEGMKEVDREILLLRYFERLSGEECASVLGISESAAKVRHLRAVRRLRELLGSLGAPEDFRDR